MKKKNHKLTLGKEIISSLIKVEIKGGKNSIPWGITKCPEVGNPCLDSCYKCANVDDTKLRI